MELFRRVIEVRSCQLSRECCGISLPFLSPKLSEGTLTKLRLGKKKKKKRTDEQQKLWVYLSYWEKVTFVPLEFGGMFEYRDSQPCPLLNLEGERVA